MRQEYRYLEYHGRCIFNAVYDQDEKEMDTRGQELIKELLRIFQTETVSSVRENGEVPNISSLIKEVRAAISQGILTEALELSENQKQVLKGSPDSFPVRNAVNTSRKKIEDILQSFQDHGPDAATGYIKRLLEESRGETNEFKTRAEEALQKQTILEVENERLIEERDKMARKAEMTLKETMRAIQRNKALEQSLTDKTIAMELLDQKLTTREEANLWLEEEKNKLEWEIATISANLIELTKKVADYEADLQKQTVALEAANARIQELERGKTAGEKAQKVLASIAQKLQIHARDGKGNSERLASVFQELAELRTERTRFEEHQILYSRAVEKSEKLSVHNDTLLTQLGYKGRLNHKTEVESILDASENAGNLLLKDYYFMLIKYFAALLQEVPKVMMHIGVLRENTIDDRYSKEVRAMFSSLRTHWFNSLLLWENKLQEIKQRARREENLRKFNTTRDAVDLVYNTMIQFLQDPGSHKPELLIIQSIEKKHARGARTYQETEDSYGPIDIHYKERARA